MTATEPQHPICDFCSEPNPAHRIRVRSFWVQDVVPVTEPMHSIGDFLACHVCNGFILVGNREALIARAREAFIRNEHTWDLNAELELRQFYKQFWENVIRE